MEIRKTSSLSTSWLRAISIDRTVSSCSSSPARVRGCQILVGISDIRATSADFENQKAGLLVLRDRNLKSRAIGWCRLWRKLQADIVLAGVLTKVDRIPSQGAQKWLKILQGESNVLAKGWYCVKQPDQRQIDCGLSREEARLQEQAFFESEVPWSKMSRHHLRRVGSENLAECLGATLSELVAKEYVVSDLSSAPCTDMNLGRLPKIQAKVDAALISVRRDLARMAAPNIENPTQEVNRLFSSFYREVSKHVDGKPPIPDAHDSESTVRTGLWRALHETFESFRDNVLRTAPQFRPWSSMGFVSEELISKRTSAMRKLDETVGTGTVNVLYADQVLRLAKR